MAVPETKSSEPDGDGDGWLERNADIQRVRDARGTESWERAKKLEKDRIESLEGLGRFVVTLPDGESHRVIAIKNGDGDLVGACDCEGFRYHSHPCAHLCGLAQLDVVETGILPKDHGEASELAFSVDAEVVEYHGDDEDALEDVEEPPEAEDEDLQELDDRENTERIESEGGLPADRSELLDRAVEAWGIDDQADMAIEESAELIVALEHQKRGRDGSLDEFVEELADVWIMAAQLSRYIGPDRVKEAVEDGLDRLEDRLEGAEP